MGIRMPLFHLPVRPFTSSGFQEDFRFLSNFYERPFEYLGITYKCSEAAYQAAKFSDEDFRKRFENLNGAQSKKLGRGMHWSYRNDWDQVKVQVMKDILRAKFQDKFLALLLLSTNGIDLVEVNTWNDRFWGVCHGRGENMLGKLLMELREELKIVHADSSIANLQELGKKTLGLN
jgi:hypothetical protein